MNNKRLLIVVISVLLFFVAIAGKLFYIQIIRSDDLKYYAQRQQTYVEKVKAERGCIYDRDGNLLVYNKSDVSLFADVRMMKDRDKEIVAKKLSDIFGRSESYYLNILNKEKRNACLERKIPKEKALLLKDFKANGFYTENDETRVYEYGSLASHVLGYVNSEYVGQDGIEKSFNKYLCGEDGSMLIHRNARGEIITVEEQATKPAIPGNNVCLTINKSYQIILEEELKNGLAQFGGNSATGILMDPNTGEILALANKDDYDPNCYWKVNDTVRRNKALTDIYEPGSTFKCISMAALLDLNLCHPNEKVFTENGAYKFKNVMIKDSHKGGWTTVKGVIEESSNIGMAKLIQRIKSEDFYRYARGFGFGNITSIKLPAENKGILKNPSVWSEVNKATMSYGYSVQVTPLQMVTAYSALVNGGFLYEPQLVKRQTDIDNNVLFENKPVLVRRVISKHTSDIIRDFLVGVVEEGTAKAIKIEGLKMGGKTGTSMQFLNGKYSKEHYFTSYVGFFPADNPKIVGLILVNAPVNGKYGGTVAAPIFKNVAQRIMKTDSKDILKSAPVDKSNSNGNKIPVSYAKNTNKTPAQSVTKLLSDEKCLTKHTMPDLRKYTGRDAIIALSKLGVQYKVRGFGKVISQSIEPGQKISNKTICEVYCEDKKITGASIY